MLLKFDLEAVRKQFEHAKKSDTHKPSFIEHEDGITPQPALWFVKDNGIYIMSNGEAPDRPDVVYAQGYNPNTDGEVWDKCRDAVGGDDFCELIYHDTALALTNHPNAKTLGIKVTESALDFRLYG